MINCDARRNNKHILSMEMLFDKIHKKYHIKINELEQKHCLTIDCISLLPEPSRAISRKFPHCIHEKTMPISITTNHTMITYDE